MLVVAVGATMLGPGSGILLPRNNTTTRCGRIDDSREQLEGAEVPAPTVVAGPINCWQTLDGGQLSQSSVDQYFHLLVTIQLVFEFQACPKVRVNCVVVLRWLHSGAYGVS